MMSKQVEPRYLEITALIDRVCRQYLNEEYAEMGRKLAARLAQKSPSPLLRGRPEVWACAIVYAIGTVNFLFSPSFEPYLSAEELCQAFGVKKNTGSNKAVQIRKMFGMRYMTPEWTLPSHIIRNHLVWLVIMDGMLVDIRDMPREVQELAYKQGLIPYIPADREKS
ncbi:MAG: hypothetical protein D6775_07880 [Caldilineae bacterium]|nr:MAG: hypothetical protein D6775_07880 [Caldilineae bacterium]